MLRRWRGHFVEGSEGLIEQQDPGTQDQGTGNGHPLSHPPRQLSGLGALEALQPYKFNEVGHGFVIVALSGDLQRETDVVVHRPPGEQCWVLKGHAYVVLLTSHLRALAMDQY